ncbi:unnamed protein product [Ambrosiozyma monospora]|uniref:Unnamed protein product n=1 Tax=Ambrosiozyma monospora TaxID=43982 RepID=A0ACB5TA00_AMBMO|nr:unnamed protein product [Ambrosiozyma monospora]
MINDMKYRYPVNHNRLPLSSGFALGRYPEDIYNGYGTSEGNPWFISTSTAAEFIYKLIFNLYNRQMPIDIDINQSPIFEKITNLKINKDTTIPFGCDAFRSATASLVSFGDTFLDIIREHVDDQGHMSEQFNKYDGFMAGAEELTWSYSSFWSAMRWRDKALEIMKKHTGCDA